MVALASLIGCKGKGDASDALYTIPTDSILLSDPCVLADSATGLYYMTGTQGMLFTSKDLKMWSKPEKVANTSTIPWAGSRPEIWAAELHKYGDKYYYFATFTNPDTITGQYEGRNLPRRSSHILRSDSPSGPYSAFGDAATLPDSTLTLDGTLWVEPDGTPYMVYCGEWLQNGIGTMECIPLKQDLSGAAGKATVLFTAHDSPWSREEPTPGQITPNRVTDGPYLFRTDTGRLGMLWTSWVFNSYTQGVAYSKSGTIFGPWEQQPEPITPPNYGHGMLFKTLDGQWLLSCHSHANVDGRYVRIPHFFKADLSGDNLKITF